MILNKFQKEKWELKGFQNPTEIQKNVYDYILNSENIVGISPTGSGKTLAYALPLLQKTEKNGELQVLVLAPSQELAQQIGQVFRDWNENLTIQVIAGGANVKRQIENLKKKPEIIVATPKRLIELLKQSKKIKCHQIKTVVIDEADYLLKDEHLTDVREIVRRAPSRSNLLLFSATVNQKMYELQKWFNRQANVVEVNQPNNISHGFLVVEKRKRGEMMKKLAQIDNMRALVFVNNIANLAVLSEKLLFEGIKIAVLHSDMHHIKRKEAIEALKSGHIKFLLTTDVAARGIDVADLPVVIQYDLPRERESYLHRSGRTGRMSKEGLVLSFIDQYVEKEYYALTKAFDVKEYNLKNKLLIQK